jgi:hypothetical protein
MENLEEAIEASPSFFDRPQVHIHNIPVGRGVPAGIESVSNPQIGVGGAYGTWGECYSNASLPDLVRERSGEPLSNEETLNLAELGFSQASRR